MARHGECSRDVRRTKGNDVMNIWAVSGFFILYLVLMITLGVITFRKHRWVMFGLGFIFPILWIIGVFLPPRGDSDYYLTASGPF